MVGRGSRVLIMVLGLVLLDRAEAHVLKGQPTSNDDPIKRTSTPSPADNMNTKRSQPPLIPERINREISEDLFEGDIILTPEQKLLLQQRKASNNLWPKEDDGSIIIGYRIGSDIDAPQLMLAIAHWEENTCIRFEEVASDVGYTHLSFQDSNGCSSYVGWIASFTSGQGVFLHSSCIREVGPAVHEIGHALGFNHEQSRSDRDEYVKIIWENIKDGKAGNFQKRATNNYGVPYDYYSVMHYGDTDFSETGERVIVATDPRMQTLMTNRKGLTFADKLLANAMYGCLDQWLTECSITSDPCQNLGYTGPDCNCVCPEGTSGSQCEILLNSYAEALLELMTPHTEIITTEGVVSTPGYPTPIQERMSFVKVLVAPPCHHVQLTVNDFHVYPGSCNVDSLNIRTNDSIESGTTYCGRSIAPGTVFLSETDTIVLDYFNYNYSALTWDSSYRGFEATVEHIPYDESCSTVTTADPDTTTFSLQVDTINSGDIAVSKASSSSGPCGLNGPTDAGDFELTSQWYPSSYWPWMECDDDMQTSEPRYLIVTAEDVRVGSSDTIVIQGLFGDERKISEAEEGNTFYFPSSSIKIYFYASSWWFGRGFKLSLDVQNTDCHQIIRVLSGESGTLSKTDYVGNTVCEWWIQAPSGNQIRLDFTSFNVGESDCSTDYLAIDISGDPRYGINAQQYCGRNTPGSVTSTGGQLNVLLSGFYGWRPGFEATITIV